jgi:methionyl-tRNA synthetase
MSETTQKPIINYEDFSKLDIRIATVISAEAVEGADKLLKITLDVGDEIGERTIAAGIKAWYSPEDLVGQQIVYLANLAPRELRGVVSQGMLLAAGDTTAILIQPTKSVDSGTKIR